MRNTFRLLAAIILFPTLSFAQSNFKPGYLITFSGDTLKGTVDYREWGDNPKSVTFKPENGSAAKYNAGDCKGFGVIDKAYYEAYYLAISMDQVVQNNLADHYDSTQVKATVFLRLIAKGSNLKLYSYADDLKSRFFIIKKGSNIPVELSYHLYMDGNRVININRYRYQLAEYAEVFEKKTEAISRQINRANYRRADLIGIVDAINGQTTQIVEKKASSGVRYFAGLSLNASKIKHYGQVDLTHNAVNHINYIPQLNAGIDYLQNADVGRLIFRAELSVYNGKLRAEATNGFKEFKQFTVSLHPQVMYNFFNSEAFTFFLNAGFIAHVSSYSQYNYQITNAQYTFPGRQKTESLWVAPSFKAGFAIKKRVEFSAGMELPGTFEKDGFTLSRAEISAYQVGVNYFFSL